MQGLRARAPRRRADERGVVSIEYLVLGAVIAVLVAVLATSSEVQQALESAFVELFGG